MKYAAFIFMMIIFLTSSKNIIAQNNQYDSVLAKQLQADDYGMKNYILVILKKGTANITDKKVLDSLFAGHMANIQRLAAENKLLVAGPMGENDKQYEGIFVFNTVSIDEARQWLNTDPAFQANDLDAELYAWYCSAALQQVSSIREKIQKKNY